MGKGGLCNLLGIPNNPVPRGIYFARENGQAHGREGRAIATGTVKWFNNAKGYGFILPSDGGGDLFAHYTAIEMEGYKTLKAGQPVVFDVEEGPKGHHAVNIRAEAEDGA